MRWVGNSTWILSMESLEEKNRKNPTLIAQFLMQVQHFLVFIPSSVQMVFAKGWVTSTRFCHTGQDFCPWGCVQTGEMRVLLGSVQAKINQRALLRRRRGRMAKLVGRRKENTFVFKNSTNRGRTLIPTPKFNMIRTRDTTGPLVFAF